MVVVDTNILAYLLISGDRTREARRLYEHDPEWRSEAFLLIEFSNLLATYVRLDRLSHAKSEKVLEEAESRIHGLVRLPHLKVLGVAHRFKVSAYDARFLAAAESLNTKLVTEDAKLRAAAPGRTQFLAEALDAD